MICYSCTALNIFERFTVLVYILLILRYIVERYIKNIIIYKESKITTRLVIKYKV